MRSIKLAVAVCAVVIGVASLSCAPALVASASTLTAAASSYQGPADADSANSATSAVAIADEYDHSVLIDSASTATVGISANPDGTFEANSSSTPQRVRAGDGSWDPVDTNLEVAADGSVEPHATDVPVKFSTGSSDVLAQIRTTDGSWVAEHWSYGDLPAPVLSGDTATYSEVLPGVDLQLTAESTGMSEIVVVKNADAAANPTLKDLSLTVSGATVSQTAGGTTVATSASGSALTSASPTWWDSTVAGSDSDGPAGSVNPRPVVHSVDGSDLVLNVATPAQTAGVHYPVFIDPDWTGDRLHYWYVDSAYPTTNYADGAQSTTSENVGYIAAADNNNSDGRTHLARAFWQVSMKDDAGHYFLSGANIISATFGTTEVHSFNCTPSQVDLYRVSSIDYHDTYSSMPATSTVFPASQKQDDATVAYGYSSSCPSHSVGFTATEAAQYASDHNPTTLSFGLKAHTETSSVSWKRFSPTVNFKVTFDHAPAIAVNPRLTQPDRGCGTSAAPVQVNNVAQAIGLTVDVDDVDYADFGDTVRGSVVVTPVTAGVATPTVVRPLLGAPGPSTATIAMNSLVEGAIYSWTARSVDKAATYSTTWTSPCYFQEDSLSPGTPTVTLASGPTSYTVGQPVSVTLTDPQAANDLGSEYIYWLAISSGSAAVPVLGVDPKSDPLPACGTGAGEVRFACEGLAASNGTASVSVAPLDRTTTLWVAIVDGAGNVGSPQPTTLQVGTAFNLRDSTHIQYSAGHDWATVPNPLSSPIGDYQNPAPISLPVSTRQSVTGASGDNYGATVSSNGYVEINDLYSGAGSGLVEETVANGESRSGWTMRYALGQMVQPVGALPTGMQKVYACAQGAGNKLSLSSTCSPGPATVLAYSWIAAPAGLTSQKLYACLHPSTDHYASTDPLCGSDAAGVSLGYAVTVPGALTAASVVDISQSFTVSAELSTSLMSGATTAVAGPVGGGGDGFTLGTSIQSDGNPYYAFCLTNATSASTVASDCVYSKLTVTTNASWGFVTGTWDAANQQLRISFDSSPGNSAYHQGAATAESASIQIGQGTFRGVPTQWQGSVADVSIFQGVATGDQTDAIKHLFPIPS